MGNCEKMLGECDEKKTVIIEGPTGIKTVLVDIV